MGKAPLLTRQPRRGDPTRDHAPPQGPSDRTGPLGADRPHPADLLTISMRVEAGWVVVRIVGELDLATGGELVRAIEDSQLIDTTQGIRLALDVAELRFCDSSGLAALLRLRRRVAQAHGRYLLLKPGPRLSELIRRTRLSPLLPMADTLS